MNTQVDAAEPKERIIVNGLDSTPGVPTAVGSFVLRPKFTREYLGRLRASGLHAANVTVIWPGETFEGAVRKTIQWRRLIQSMADVALIVTSTQEIQKAVASHRFAVIFGSEDPAIIGDRPEYLETFYLLGHRTLQLTYQKRNLIGSGCGERNDEGLSLFGLEIVAEMNRLGMLIDVSHCGPQTTADAIVASKDPIAITHSSVQVLSGHIRAKTDEQIQMLARNGGVIGICALSQYLKPDGSQLGTTLTDFLDHIDHVFKLVGEEHVGIGLDNHEGSSREEYDNFTREYPDLKPRNYDTRVVSELESVTGIPLLIDRLSNRGYSERQIDKIVGGNWLRLYGDVWKD